MNSPAREYDLLELIPLHNIKWEENSTTGLVELMKPKFNNAILKKYLLPKLQNRFYVVKLDKIGSFVWKKINGENKIRDIAQALEEEFGESIQPVTSRLSKFIYSLNRNQFIKLK